MRRDVLIRGLASGGKFDITKVSNAEGRTELSCIGKEVELQGLL